MNMTYYKMDKNLRKNFSGRTDVWKSFQMKQQQKNPVEWKKYF